MKRSPMASRANTAAKVGTLLSTWLVVVPAMLYGWGLMFLAGATVLAASVVAYLVTASPQGDQSARIEAQQASDAGGCSPEDPRPGP